MAERHDASYRRAAAIAVLAFAAIMLVGHVEGSRADADSSTFPEVHRYHDPDVGFLNVYLVETEAAVVAVDAGFLTHQARELRAMVDSTGKPLAAILLTHDHADHYNGAAILAGERDVPVVATARTDWVIRSEDRMKAERYAPAFGAAYPRVRVFPTRVLQSGDHLDLDGVRFTVHDMGVGESRSDAWWLVEGNGKRFAFVGDLVMNRVHAFFQSGQTGEWLASLERLESDLGAIDTLFPGHGEPGSVELIDWQRRYIQTYRSAVAELVEEAVELEEADRAALIAEMRSFLPGGRLEFFVPLGADIVAAELARERARRDLDRAFRQGE